MQMSRRAALVLVTMGVSGCSLFGSDEAEDAEIPVPEDGLAARGREPVERIEALEIGRTATGISLTAFAIAPGLGYGRPALVARREGAAGPDGYLEFDFLAVPPDPDRNLPVGEPQARIVRADALLGSDLLRGVRGLRVFSLTNGRQVDF